MVPGTASQSAIENLFGQILRHPDAQAAVETLRKGGLDLRNRSDGDRVLVACYFFLYLDWAGEEKPHPYVRSRIRRFHALPQKLRTLAGELETLSELSELATQMREAAGFLDATIARGSKVGPARKHRADIRCELEKIVKRRTSRVHRKEIALLLTLACQLARKENIVIDADSVKQATESMKQASYRRRKGHLAPRRTPSETPSRDC